MTHSLFRDSADLPGLLAHRRWLRRDAPFPHLVAHSVFVEPFYRELEGAFQEVVRRGFDEQMNPDRFGRSMAGYDAYGYNFTRDMAGPFRVFLSRAWHDLIAGAAGVQATGDIHGGLHHHHCGSANGQVHNDLNPGWFVDDPTKEGITVSHHALCSYTHGTTFGADLTARETVRAVAVLYYLANPPWSPGDGGSTGLYACGDTPVERPVGVVPPVNNSLLIFECTPFSYHTFIRNWRHPRNSVILWLHRPKADAVKRWGPGKIIDW